MGVVVSVLPQPCTSLPTHPQPLGLCTTFEPCNHTINGNDNVMFRTNDCSFFLLLAFSVHIVCLPTNLANSLLGLSFSAEVILGMYLLIGPPHSRSNYRVWCKYRAELKTNPIANWIFFSSIFILLTNVCCKILSYFISNHVHFGMLLI